MEDINFNPWGIAVTLQLIICSPYTVLEKSSLPTEGGRGIFPVRMNYQRLSGEVQIKGLIINQWEQRELTFEFVCFNRIASNPKAKIVLLHILKGNNSESQTGSNYHYDSLSPKPN